MTTTACPLCAPHPAHDDRIWCGAAKPSVPGEHVLCGCTGGVRAGPDGEPEPVYPCCLSCGRMQRRKAGSDSELECPECDAPMTAERFVDALERYAADPDAPWGALIVACERIRALKRSQP